MTDERQEVSAEQFETIKAILGLDAATFRRTKLGQYIFDRIEMQQENAVEELIELAAASSDLTVARKANEIAMHRMLPKYIEEAMQAGRAAEENIQQQESTEPGY